MMPTHSCAYCDPEIWEHPPVPQHWHHTIRAHMPLYDKKVTPTLNVGVVPEVFRSWPGVERSDHPLVSFGVWGANSREVRISHIRYIYIYIYI